MIKKMKYKVALKLGDSYGKEKRGYLASSRIRGHWLAKYWKECDDYFYPEEFKQSSEEFFNVNNQLKILKKYQVIIFNKTYEWKLAEELVKRGQKVIVDMCDPDHLLSHSSEQRVNDCIKTLKAATAIVVNGDRLKYSVKKNLSHLGIKKPIYIIPDRIDFSVHYPRKATHQDKVKSVVWYGYSENLRVLDPYIQEILEMGIDITVVSDKFFSCLPLPASLNAKDHITFKVWHPETINQEIIKHDLVFTGQDSDPYYSQWKSNNRTLTALALKVPVAKNIKELKALLSKQSRCNQAGTAYFRNGEYYYPKKEFDVKTSVNEYKEILKEIL